MQDTEKNEGFELLTDRMLENVSGAGLDNPEFVFCPNCGAKVWYDFSGRARYAYECNCGWYSGRT